MNIVSHTDLLDRLAAAYALGSLRGGARRRFEAMAREHAAVRAAALVWHGRIQGMNELQPVVAPAPTVWARIHNLVQAEREGERMAQQRTAERAQPQGGWWQNLAVWRGAVLAGLAATLVLAATALNLRSELGAQIDTLQAQLKATPQVQYVAVLNDAQATASMLVTFDPSNQRLTLQRVGGFREAPDRSLQLWALPPTGQPRSLGVLSPQRLVALAAGVADVREVPTLAISLEPKGGVPSATGPTGPILFTGALIQKML